MCLPEETNNFELLIRLMSIKLISKILLDDKKVKNIKLIKLFKYIAFIIYYNTAASCKEMI